MTALEEIRKLYFNAKRNTVKKDIARAIDLFKTMTDDDDRQKAAVYMDGLSQMRSEWAQGKNEDR
jgi:hypothetical protein